MLALLLRLRPAGGRVRYDGSGWHGGHWLRRCARALALALLLGLPAAVTSPAGRSGARRKDGDWISSSWVLGAFIRVPFIPRGCCRAVSGLASWWSSSPVTDRPGRCGDISAWHLTAWPAFRTVPMAPRWWPAGCSSGAVGLIRLPRFGRSCATPFPLRSLPDHCVFLPPRSAGGVLTSLTATGGPEFLGSPVESVSRTAAPASCRLSSDLVAGMSQQTTSIVIFAKWHSSR